MAVLGVTSVSPALPSIREALGLTNGQVGLLITAFTLPGIVLTLVLGVMADRYGRKKILVPSLFLFGIVGGACFFARSFELLLILRFVQGMGASALGALNTTIIGDIYSGRERSAALGYNSSVLSIGTAGYPAIGGLLATLGWFYPFALAFIAVPVGLLVIFSLHNPEPRSEERLKDYLGSVISHLRSREALGLLCASLFTFIIVYGSQITFLPILMHERFGTPSFLIGLVISSSSVATAITSSQIGRLTGYFSEKTLLKSSFLLYAASLVLIAFIPSLWLLLVPMFLFGVAQGINLPNAFSLLNSLAPSDNRGAFMSVNGMSLRSGQTIGPLFMALVVGLLGLTGGYVAVAGLTVVIFAAIAFLVR